MRSGETRVGGIARELGSANHSRLEDPTRIQADARRLLDLDRRAIRLRNRYSSWMESPHNLLEAELLASPREWTPAEIEGELPAPPRHLIVDRNEHLQIVAKFVGPSPRPAPRRPEPILGEMVVRKDLRVGALEGVVIKLESFFDGGWNINGMDPAELTVHGLAHAVEVQFADLQPEFGTEWVLGLPTSMWIWPDSTKRVNATGYRRARGDWALEKSVPEAGQSYSRDHARLKLSLDGGILEFLVGRGAKGKSPRGAGFLEYRSELPDRPQRDRIRGALGFAMGRGVHCVGWTTYTDAGIVCTARGESAYSPGGVGQLESSAMPPAPLGDERYLNVLHADKLSAVVAALVRAHEEYDLGHLYWLLWHGAVGSLDLAAGEYGSALEHLRRQYYKREDREHRTRLLAKADWKRIQTRISAMLDQEFKGGGTGLSVAEIIFRNKVGGLNQVPGTEGARRFFEDLGLDTGEVEAKALALRNPASHGTAPDPAQHEQWLRRLRALQTLVNRVVLATTQAATSYVDYSTNGFPVRLLGQRQGGPAGDGVSA